MKTATWNIIPFQAGLENWIFRSQIGTSIGFGLGFTSQKVPSGRKSILQTPPVEKHHVKTLSSAFQ